MIRVMVNRIVCSVKGGVADANKVLSFILINVSKLSLLKIDEIIPASSAYLNKPSYF